MNEHQRQTEFLKQCILYDGSEASHTLAERLRQLQHKERCVGRAVWLMVQMGALALAGLAYLAIFTEDFPQNIPGFMTRFMTQVFCVMGLSSLICLPVFLGLQMAYRKELAHRREDCRRLATKLLESRLARPQGVGEREGSEVVVWAPAPDTGLGPVEVTTKQQTDSNTRVQAPG
jgi:hypothetical protein